MRAFGGGAAVRTINKASLPQYRGPQQLPPVQQALPLQGPGIEDEYAALDMPASAWPSQPLPSFVQGAPQMTPMAQPPPGVTSFQSLERVEMIQPGGAQIRAERQTAWTAPAPQAPPPPAMLPPPLPAQGAGRLPPAPQ